MKRSIPVVDGGGDHSCKLSKSEESFNWSTCCFICERKLKKKSKSEVTVISASSGIELFQTVRHAASIKKDDVMLSKLSQCNRNLAVIGARYCKMKPNCLRNYITIKSNNNPVGRPRKVDDALKTLKEEFHDDIIKNNKIFLFKTVKQRFDLIVSDTSLIDTR